MTEAEAFLSKDFTDQAADKAEVEKAMVRIIGACAFHDLTCQRVNKVITTLRHIKEYVSFLADALGVKVPASKETDAETCKHEPLLNGPTKSQMDIDELFGQVPTRRVQALHSGRRRRPLQAPAARTRGTLHPLTSRGRGYRRQ